MKKFILVIVIALLAGCATTPEYNKDWVPPEAMTKKANPIYDRLVECMKLREDGKVTQLTIIPANGINAQVNVDGQIFLHHATFAYGDNNISFVIAHELAHVKLNHVRYKQTVSVVTTGAMMVANAIVPGLGLLNHIINPAVTNNFNKLQEYDADRLASETLVNCLGIPLDNQIKALDYAFNARSGGGFFDQHPSWEDRKTNIKNKVGTATKTDSDNQHSDSSKSPSSPNP